MVVGWPPIRAYRMNSLVNQSKENTSAHATITSTHKKASQNIKNNKTGERICCKEIEKKGRSSVNSLFVKVNLDGDPIGRKVDLSSYPSYETLALALEAMFLRQTLVLGSSICEFLYFLFLFLDVYLITYNVSFRTFSPLICTF